MEKFRAGRCHQLHRLHCHDPLFLSVVTAAEAHTSSQVLGGGLQAGEWPPNPRSCLRPVLSLFSLDGGAAGLLPSPHAGLTGIWTRIGDLTPLTLRPGVTLGTGLSALTRALLPAQQGPWGWALTATRPVPQAL